MIVLGSKHKNLEDLDVGLNLSYSHKDSINNIDSNTMSIVYPSGACGSFILWAIFYFTGKIDLWNTEVKTDTTIDGVKIIRLHPKLSGNDSALENTKYIIDTSKKTLQLYTDYQNFALGINNKYEKHNFSLRDEDFAVNLNGWGVKSLADLEKWQIRELLSFYAWEQHQSETEIDSIKTLTDDKLLNVEIGLLHNSNTFEQTIRSIMSHFNIPVVRQDFENIYNKWIALQHHHYKDELLEGIITNTLNSTYYDWSNKKITLIDEALLQYKLRNLGFELKCFGLNDFPNNTTQLETLLEHV